MRVRMSVLMLAVLMLFPGALRAQADGETIVTSRLVADTKAIQAGKPFTIGVYFQLEPGWHLYWENSGDGGLPIGVEWKLPEGFKVSALRWPAPIRFEEAGGLTSFGYSKETMLLATMTPPKALKGGSVTMAAELSWLTCKEVCIPGDAKVDLKVPVGPVASSQEAALIARFQQKMPQPARPILFASRRPPRRSNQGTIG